MLQRLHVKNYRSIVDATVELRPFTVLIGANGSGKSNLLRLLRELSLSGTRARVPLPKHFSRRAEPTRIDMLTGEAASKFEEGRWLTERPNELAYVEIFAIDPNRIGSSEALAPQPTVAGDGSGAVQVLDSLKTGDREDLFDAIEAKLREFVPEIEKLSFVPGENQKRLQVREAKIATPVPVSELSEGTRLVLTILTLAYQERKPSIICLEDLDRGLHPALFGKVVEVCRALASQEGGPQIIATTHNPYLVDQFIDDEESVVIVEKADAMTTFVSLRERLEGLDRGDESLGGVWYSRLVGGVPALPVRHLATGPSAR